MEPIILASSSPRRQEILKMLNIPFRMILPDLDETIPETVAPKEAPAYLAVQKVKAVKDSIPADQTIKWILGADTLIEMDGELFGKPADSSEAEAYLKKLSGKTHAVVSAFAIYSDFTKQIETSSKTTEVTFAQLSDREIEWYIETGEWHNAAGGYRLQGLAACFIKNITGSPSGVIGLPIFELYDMLKKLGYSVID